MYRKTDDEIFALYVKPDALPPSKRLFVLAANRNQFEYYCKTIGRSHRDPKITLVTDTHQLRGLSPGLCDIVALNEWYTSFSRRSWSELYAIDDQLEDMESRGFTITGVVI